MNSLKSRAPNSTTIARRLKAAVAVVACWCTLCAFSVLADYPIVSHRYAADPAAMEFNGRLYLYCSNDDENGTNSYVMSSLTCFSTDDLKNWTDHGVVFRANTTSWANLTWAPSAISNNNRIYLYFANGAGSIGVATSSVPTGPFVDARGGSLINGSTPGASSPTQWLFDPGAFIDDNGQAYLYFGGQYPTNSRVIRLNSNLTSVSGSAQPLDTPNFFEAAHLHKRNGIYYLSYSTRPNAGLVIGCVTNSNPTNGFVAQSTVLANPPQNVNNNNHHSIVSYLGNWYIVYHNRAVALANGLSNADAVYKRSLCLDAVNYSASGAILQTIPTTDGLPQLKNLNPFTRVEAETIAKQSGIKTEACTEGGLNVTSITNGSWIRVRGINFHTGATMFFARVASAGSGGNIELRLDSPGGTLVGTCAVPSTGGWQTWTTISCHITNAIGVRDLYLRFTGGAGDLFNFNWWQFQAGGTSSQGIPVTIEAESGALGANWTVSNSGSPAYITITNTGAGGNPGSAARVATYNVTFPAAGTYELYARIRVGPGGFNDDSLFYGNGFGVKSPTSDADWILANGLAGAGFTAPGDVVAGVGAAGSQVWKWVNLSQYDNPGSGSELPITFTIPAGDLTQTFQIAAREDGLDIDKLVFGPAGYQFTVADLDSGVPGTQPTLLVTVNAGQTYQTIEGFGGAIAFYNGWVTAHPFKNEIYTNAFGGLNLSMLRLGNWFRYQGTPNFDPEAAEFVSRANQILGRPVEIMMSSWSPPAFLKSNGQVGNGGTLLYTNGGFAYNEFAQYWYDSMIAYRNIGVSPTWISIQNEPDFQASYDSCVFRPTEGVANGTNWAGYPNALSATYQRMTNLPSPPKFLGPEPVGIGFNTVQNYAATMNPGHFYGLCYHLYHGGSGGAADGYINSFRATTNLFPTKPKFMTEYGVSNMIESATLIHNALTEGLVSGYNYWSLIWPSDGLGLVQIEFPWDQSRWTNAPAGTPTQSRGYWLSPAYWSIKHYSYYIAPGSRRVAASCNNTNVRVSAFVTPDDSRLVAVLINRSSSPLTVDPSFGTFPFSSSSVYQTTGTNKFQSLGPVGPQLTLPGESLTTVVLDKFFAIGQAANPSPADTADNVPLDTSLNWSPGTNAQMHAIYLGVNSNAVAQATPASPEFKAFLITPTFAPNGLFGSSKYYWRVDELNGANTNTGPVWSFSTVAGTSLIHRYSFSEPGGTNVADSIGGPSWNGTLPNGGSFSAGQLVLSSDAQQYVNLPVGILSNLTAVTIEAWATFPANLPSTAWLFGFGNSNTISSGTSLYCVPGGGRFAVSSAGIFGEVNAYTSGFNWSGKTLHIACVVDPTSNHIAIYTNGALAATKNSGAYTLSSLINQFSYINRAFSSSGPHLDLTINEFRVYGAALSAMELAATHALGPDQLLSNERPAMSLTATPSSLTLTWPLASAGYTVQSRTNLALGDWVNVPSLTQQIVNGEWSVTLPQPTGPGETYYRLAK